MLVFCFIFFLISGKTIAQKVVLDLNWESANPKKTEYQIIEVLDHRIQKASIGEVFERGGHKLPVTFKENLDQLATRFYLENLNPKDSAQEIQVRIFELELEESFNETEKLYEGDVQLGLGFFLKGSNEPEHLLDYLGTTQYRRSGFRMDNVEEVVNKLFQNSLVYFDTWYNSQNLKNRTLAKAFRLEIIEQNQNSTEDKVYYDSARPLVWEDFKDRPSAISKNNATIFTSFSVQGISLMDSGSVVQTLEISVYMLPYQSWVKSPSSYALNHEQRHFDVTRIVADRLTHKLETMDLELDFYQARINEAYLDAYREMNRLQEFYDKQTQNGLNTAEQENWNQIIDEALAGDWRRIEDLLRSGRR
ncbi:hypothetical protein B0E43_10690 [Algoriphagus sp. A40]|nr:hypothetical protein B0E43_10690 [Algoriphagus sp. A40]